MRAKDLKHVWKPWTAGSDNIDANIDIPLMEGVRPDHLTETMSKILDTKDDDFGPAMTVKEALEWARR